MTLNRGNYVIIGQNENDSYTEFFGVVEDYTTEDGGWLKIKFLVNVSEMTEISEIKNYSVSELATIPKLESVSSEEGEAMYSSLKMTIDQRRNRLPGRGRASATVESAQAASPEAVSDEPIQQEETVQEARRPLHIPTEERIENEELKKFSINLEAGDMKTILAIGEKSPKKVFGIIDNAIEENGHIVFSYISHSMKQEFIEIKLEYLSKYERVDFQKNTCYHIKHNDEEIKVLYLGSTFWFVEKIRGFEKITDNFISLKPSFFDKMNISVCPVPDSIERLVNGGPLSEDVSYDINENRKIWTVDSLRENEIPSISSEMLGKQWEDTITFYYFMGGELIWKNLELNTFSSKDAIQKLAIARKDKSVLEMLEAA